jgi:hypothetical protein
VPLHFAGAGDRHDEGERSYDETGLFHIWKMCEIAIGRETSSRAVQVRTV